MPTYSYACTACGNRFDAVQAFTDDALTTCEKCSGRLRKLFGSVGVVFKGTGFYRTDSRESTKSTINGSAKSSSESSSSDKSTSTEKSSTATASSSPAPSTAAASS
ncbi:FmdB family zinc ribbon protein [Mycobacterium sp. pUA109]|uniref:FmdB family zinc ribbon protein n=1 Tax=Mycobacterium sp. pUA109 TaxID=3238982 RepID=UPI00351B9879